MSEVTGVVETVSIKNETRAGKALRSPLYSFKLDNQQWYNCGFDDPKVGQGDVVGFTYTEDTYGYAVQKGTVVAMESTPTTAGRTGKAIKVANDRQNSIIYQSSRKDAIQVIGIAIEAGAVTLPTTKSDKFDAILELINLITDQFAFAALSPEIVDPAVPAIDMETEDE